MTFSFKYYFNILLVCYLLAAQFLQCFFSVFKSVGLRQQLIPEGLLAFVWVQQHSIKLVKYAQGYLSQPERLWTYMSPSNRWTDYGLQLTPEEWLKEPAKRLRRNIYR